jgi:hypothetical protein
MSKDEQTQSASVASEQPANAPEVANESQDQPAQPNVGDLIAESKKYRARSQKVEAENADLKKQIESNRQKQLEEQQEWQTLAEERATRIAELEPIVEQAKQQETEIRQELLSDFDEEDRATFGDLPISKLRAVHGKIINTNPRVNVDSSTPSANGGYTSALEWVTNDPVGYEKAKRGSGSLSKFGNIFNPSGEG